MLKLLGLFAAYLCFMLLGHWSIGWRIVVALVAGQALWIFGDALEFWPHVGHGVVVAGGVFFLDYFHLIGMAAGAGAGVMLHRAGQSRLGRKAALWVAWLAGIAVALVVNVAAHKPVADAIFAAAPEARDILHEIEEGRLYGDPDEPARR